MRSHVLLAGLCLALCGALPTTATIKNGYTDIAGAVQSLRKIEKLLREDSSLTFEQRSSMKGTRKRLRDYITYGEMTRQMLSTFQLISPGLFASVDSVRDRMCLPVDVYVQLVPENAMPPGVFGATNLEQDLSDANVYRSEFGVRTISIRIAAANQSLRLLAHEFGHARYQAEHLAQYMIFFKRHNPQNRPVRKSRGHSDQDPSGKSARIFEQRFENDLQQFLKTGHPRPVSHLALLHHISAEVEARVLE